MLRTLFPSGSIPHYVWECGNGLRTRVARATNSEIIEWHKLSSAAQGHLHVWRALGHHTLYDFEISLLEIQFLWHLSTSMCVIKLCCCCSFVRIEFIGSSHRRLLIKNELMKLHIDLFVSEQPAKPHHRTMCWRHIHQGRKVWRQCECLFSKQISSKNSGHFLQPTSKLIVSGM